MSQQTRLAALITAIGADIKAINTARNNLFAGAVDAAGSQIQWKTTGGQVISLLDSYFSGALQTSRLKSQAKVDGKTAMVELRAEEFTAESSALVVSQEDAQSASVARGLVTAYSGPYSKKVLGSDGTSDFAQPWLDSAWEALTLTSGWTSLGGGYGPVSARRDGSGRVHLRGLVKNTSAGANQTIPLVLPTKFIPLDTTPKLVVIYTGTGAEQTGIMYVHGSGSATPGRLAISPGISNNGYISLGGIVLPTAA